MELPEAIKIGAFTYRLSTPEKVTSPEGDDCLGYISYQHHTIQVKAGLPDDLLAVALVHESLHGIAEILRITLREKQVVRLAPALVALLRDNPALAALLTKE